MQYTFDNGLAKRASNILPFATPYKKSKVLEVRKFKSYIHLKLDE